MFTNFKTSDEAPTNARIPTNVRIHEMHTSDHDCLEVEI